MGVCPVLKGPRPGGAKQRESTDDTWLMISFPPRRFPACCAYLFQPHNSFSPCLHSLVVAIVLGSLPQSTPSLHFVFVVFSTPNTVAARFGCWW